MKLDKFFDKRTPVQQRRSPIVVQNDFKVDQLNQQISELESTLTNQTVLQQERDEAIRERILAEELKISLQHQTEVLEETNVLQNTTLIEYERRLEQIPSLEDDVQSQTVKASSLQNQLMDALAQVNTLGNDLNLVNKTIIALRDENNMLLLSEQEANSSQKAISDEFKSLTEQFEKIKTFSDENSKIRQDLVKEVAELRDNRNYWQKEAEEAKIQVDQTVIIEDRLKNWVSKLEQEESSSRTKRTVAQSMVKDLKVTITEMGTTIDDLMKERNYLQQMNAEYRKQLEQPRYLSMGSIMARESFSMPFAKENIRTQYLGNASPKLLKFKKKAGESNDNN